MDGLKMKYFVLNPRSKITDDSYAEASRKAMRAYARHIGLKNADLCNELLEWANREADRAHDLKYGTDFAGSGL